MKRYMVFAFSYHTEMGGLDDVRDSFGSLPLAVDYAKKLHKEDEVQIFDRYRGVKIDVSLYILHRTKDGTKNHLITHKH